jgi:BMFP domain-containing protein YqiC
MNFEYWLDYSLDVSKVLTGALVAFILYNINNKRSEKRKQSLLDQEKKLETEQKLIEANDMIGKQEILTAINQLSTGLNGKIDNLATDLNGKISQLAIVIQALDAKVDKQGADLSSKIDKLDAKVDKQGADLSSKIDKLDAKVDKQGADLSSKIDKQGADLGSKIDKLDAKLTTVASNQSNLVTELRALGHIRNTEALKL